MTMQCQTHIFQRDALKARHHTSSSRHPIPARRTWCCPSVRPFRSFLPEKKANSTCINSDIKPENLLFERIPIIPSKYPVQRQYDEEKEDEGEFIPGRGGGGIGKVKLADFGYVSLCIIIFTITILTRAGDKNSLSKVVWNEDTMTPCGTVGYTAPEIVKDERYSKSVDMWALGCVLYTLLCGFPPFYDESVNVLTEKVARGYYTFLSPWWDDISASGEFLFLGVLKREG